MSPTLKIALRLQDMFILLAVCFVFLGVAYLFDRVCVELREGSFHATNYSPWQMPEFTMLLAALSVGAFGLFPDVKHLSWPGYQGHPLAENAGQVALVLAGFFLFLGLVYFMARRVGLVTGLTILHLLLTLGAGLSVCYALDTLYLGIVSSTAGTNGTVSLSGNLEEKYQLIRYSVLVFMVAQTVLLGNVLFSVRRHRPL